jgi:hypothetical protein
MAVHTNGNYVTRATGVDLSTSQYKIVNMNALRQLVLASAATDNFFGVLQDVTAAGVGANATAFIRNGAGTFKVLAGGNVTIGDALTTDAQGRAVTTVTAGNSIIGYAQESGVAGQLIEYRAQTGKL